MNFFVRSFDLVPGSCTALSWLFFSKIITVERISVTPFRGFSFNMISTDTDIATNRRNEGKEKMLHYLSKEIVIIKKRYN